MRRGPKRAKRALGRRLDGGVRRLHSAVVHTSFLFASPLPDRPAAWHFSPACTHNDFAADSLLRYCEVDSERCKPCDKQKQHDARSTRAEEAKKKTSLLGNAFPHSGQRTNAD